MPDFHSTPDKNSPPGKADTLALLKGGKKTPSEANYVASTSSEIKICHNCSSYQNPSADKSPCSKVIGLVAAGGTCDLWSARNEQNPSTPESGSHHLAIRIHTGLNSNGLTRILTESPEG